MFTLVMIYLSYSYYKRKSYSFRSFLLWAVVWLGALTLIIFPESFYGVMEALAIERTADFIVMAGFVFYAVIIFYLFITVKANDRRVENIVRALAHERAQRNKPVQKKTSTKVKRAPKNTKKRTR